MKISVTATSKSIFQLNITRLCPSCLYVNVTKFFKTVFSKNTYERLLLKIKKPQRDWKNFRDFIKTTEHRPTYHLPLTHRPTHHLPTHSPTGYYQVTLKYSTRFWICSAFDNSWRVYRLYDLIPILHTDMIF